MGFFLPLIIILVLQWVLEFILAGVIGLSYIWVYIIIDLVLAFVFSMFRFPCKDKWTNPEFHKSVAIYFVIFTVMTVLMYYI